MDFKHVLIIDDSSTSRMIIQRCMEMAGYAVGEFHYAENGLDGLAILKDTAEMDLILTDINMPKMDGLTFVRTMKKEGSRGNMPVLVVSSAADGAMEAELRANGVSGIIKKPVSPAKLREALGD